MLKKFIKISLLLLFAITIYSCKKNYNCVCTRTAYAGNNTYNTSATNQFVVAHTKSQAKDVCSSLAYDNGWQDYQGCEVK